jgi:hypothetical protein
MAKNRAFSILQNIFVLITDATHHLGKPRQCLIYRMPARRAPVYATLQPTPLKIVYPCGSSAYQTKILLLFRTFASSFFVPFVPFVDVT